MEVIVNLALWIIAGVLAFAFAGSGILKLVQPKDKLVASGVGGWAADWSPVSIKLIGVAEILGAIGLILPALVHVAPVLVPLAAVGPLSISCCSYWPQSWHGAASGRTPSAHNWTRLGPARHRRTPAIMTSGLACRLGLCGFSV
jgi:hypothetical protein